ncbi:MAG TPA: S41 family peptidase [Firmicutes bacterium]|nr:S41 family peptidase [Bacillota bacterium]
MNKRKITIGSTLMLLMLAVVSTFNITFFVASEYYNARLGNFEELESEYEKFSEVSSIVDKYFVGEYDKEEMMDAALKGYINGMGDQWSSYLTEEEYQAVLEQREGTYAGVGITISASADGQTYTVTAVAEDGPAEKAGIQVLDQLVAVDGESIAGMSYDDLNNKVHGEPGSQVVLTILRDGRQTEYAIEREEVQTSGVKAQMLDGNIGLIRIESFSTNVDQEFSQKLQQLLDEGAQGLVFDVRFNPGGFVEVLVNMLDELLPKGTIISIADKDGNSTNYTSDEEQVELPMAVLTNEYSISAAEFFAACLQEYDVATVVGEHTLGKGYAQSLIPLSDGGALNISTSRYYTPKGVSLAGVGIQPDEEVEMAPEKLANFYTLQPEEDDQLQAALETLRQQIARS